MFGLQLLLLPFQLISYVSRKSDSRRKRFLVLSAFYVLLNSTWIGSQLSFLSPYIPNELVYLTGSITVTYTYYYWSYEFGLKPTRTQLAWLMFHMVMIFITISICDLIFGVLSGGTLMLVLTYLELVVLFFAGRIILNTKFQERFRVDLRLYAVLFAAVSSIFVPFVFIFLSNETLKYLSMNMGFLFVTFSYIYLHVTQMQKEWLQLEKVLFKGEVEELEKKKIAETLKKFSSLTSREVEVAELMVQELLWKEIGDRLIINEKTATKHGSNIYSKFGVSTREEFIEQVNSLKEL